MFPVNCYRGIRKGKDLVRTDQHGRKTARVEAFLAPKDSQRTRIGHGRSNHAEISITWNDSPQALRVLSWDEENTAQGVVLIPRANLDRIKDTPHHAGHGREFGYERLPDGGNRFHGNILHAADLTKDEQLDLANEISLGPAKQIIDRPLEMRVLSELDALRAAIRARAYSISTAGHGSASPHENWMRARAEFGIKDDELLDL